MLHTQLIAAIYHNLAVVIFLIISLSCAEVLGADCSVKEEGTK